MRCKKGDGIYGGTFDDMPLAEKREDTGIACKYCNYKSVCLNTNKKKVMEKRQFDPGGERWLNSGPERQQKAIAAKDKFTILSAAAGSGKNQRFG